MVDANELLEIFTMIQIPFYVAKGLINYDVKEFESRYPEYANTPEGRMDRERTAVSRKMMLLPMPLDIIAALTYYKFGKIR